MLEKEIEAAVCRYAREKFDAVVRKYTSPQHRNVPDRIFIFPKGKLCFIEFKATGKKPTAGQDREIQRLRDRGQIVYVVDSIDLGKTLIHCFLGLPAPELGEFWG